MQLPSHPEQISVAFANERGDWSEIADATYREEVGGRKPRNYGLIGAYARIWTWSIGLMFLAFGVFLLLRQV